MNYLIFNGKFCPEGTLVAGADNRGLRYGDGLFETMKYKDGRVILGDKHLQRLWLGMQAFQFDLPKLFTKEYISNEIGRLVKKNNHNPARIRLAVWRGDGGLYDPVNHVPQFVLQSWPLLNEAPALNNNGLRLCIYRDALKSCDSFSNFKHNNYLPYLMGALYAKKQQCNDALILNQHLRICDSSIANIFILKENSIYTPPLPEGCVAGIMRGYLLNQLPALGFDIREMEIPEAALMEADEVFLTNSVYNIRWVADINGKAYLNVTTKKIFDALRKTNEAVFC
jgi:branched-chain amino acid aminotransferase